MKLKLIVAMCKNRGIGYSNNIPWKIKKDLAYFYNKTSGQYGKQLKNIQLSSSASLHIPIKKNAVIMGKNTWLSLPKYPEPLKNRDNIVLSRSILENIRVKNEIDCVNNCSLASDLIIHFSSISHIIDFCISSGDIHDPETTDDRHPIKHDVSQMHEINRNAIIINDNSKYDKYDELWVIGGSQVYDLFVKENMKNNIIDEFCITYIDERYECDTFFPVIENMNLYYISSFTQTSGIDERMDTPLPVDVYYIVFTRIDSSNIDNIKKNYIDDFVDFDVDGHANQCNADKVRYYFFTHKEDQCQYITLENCHRFTWCITRC